MKKLNNIKQKMAGIRHSICLCLLTFLFAVQGRAQIEVQTGIDMLYPVLINKDNSKLSYGQLGFGLRAGVCYKPENIQFFPMLNVAFGRTKLPLKEVGKNVVAINTNYLNVMLNENFVVPFRNSELYIYGGVGFSYLMRKGLVVSGSRGETQRAYIDSVVNKGSIFPAVNLGFEYNYGESAGKPLYITMGINFQYIMLLKDRNTYYITLDQRTTVDSYKAEMVGNVISPGFYLALHYVIRKK